MEFDAGIDRMRQPIRDREWNRLERDAYLAFAATDKAAADRIASIDLAAYGVEMAEASGRADRRVDDRVAAVYWEFDVDDDWDSAFFPCTSYARENVGDDDWAAGYKGVVPGPSMPALARHLGATWGDDPPDRARNQYLIARTVAAFGRSTQGWSERVPLCAGYHDQSLVFRMLAEDGDKAS